MLPAAQNGSTRSLVAFTLLLAGVAPSVVAGPATAAASSADWSAAIDRLNAIDPQFPDTLEARLSYADFLTQSQEGDCRTRLQNAQSQLDLVTAAPATAIALSSGTARAAAVDYQIHLARAECDSDDSARERELRAALDAAQRAMELYQASFDAVAMTTMQFNASVAYRKLGDHASSIAALQATITLDREYGYRDDASDNYRLLLSWSGKPAGEERVAELMKDFPQRSINLTFHPSPAEVHVDYSADYTRLLGDFTVHTRGTRSAVCRIEKHGPQWLVSYQPMAIEYAFGTFPVASERLDDYLVSLGRMLFNFHDFVINEDGGFDRTSGAGNFGRRVKTETRALYDQLRQSVAQGSLKRRFDHAVNLGVKLDLREAQVAQDYDLEQGTWIGAALEQGVWYALSAPMSLPVAPQLFALHQIEFAFTRLVPCAPGSEGLACVEIVLRAQPDAASLQSLLQSGWNVSPKLTVHMSWNTEMRLVVDPATLQPRLREMRHHTYVSAQGAPEQTVIEAEKTLYVYGATQPLP